MQILLAEDDRVVRQSLTDLLRKAGYSVRAARDGAEALKAFAAHRPDLLLLDVMMPELDGLEVCRRVRAEAPHQPILFLTALDSEKDELRGLGVGADDYVSKLVPSQILLARLAALSRRMTCSVEPHGGFSIGSAVIDPVALEVREGSRVQKLTMREVEILRWFATHPGEVASADFLLTRFWADDSGTSALRTQMSRLRDKLGTAASRLTSIWRVGYMLQSP